MFLNGNTHNAGLLRMGKFLGILILIIWDDQMSVRTTKISLQVIQVHYYCCLNQIQIALELSTSFPPPTPVGKFWCSINQTYGIHLSYRIHDWPFFAIVLLQFFFFKQPSLLFMTCTVTKRQDLVSPWTPEKTPLKRICPMRSFTEVPSLPDSTVEGLL